MKRLKSPIYGQGNMSTDMVADAGSVPLVYGSLLLLVITLIILYLKPKSSIQPSLKATRTATSLEVPTTPGKPTVRILYGTQVRANEGNPATEQCHVFWYHYTLNDTLEGKAAAAIKVVCSTTAGGVHPVCCNLVL
jgi:hypothetical protein